MTVPAADAGLRHAPVGLSEDAAEPAPLCPDGADPHPPASRVIPPSAAARQHLPAADISLCITIPTTPRLSAWLDCPISSYPSEFKDPRAGGRPDRSHPRPDGSGSGGKATVKWWLRKRSRSTQRGRDGRPRCAAAAARADVIGSWTTRRPGWEAPRVRTLPWPRPEPVDAILASIEAVSHAATAGSGSARTTPPGTSSRTSPPAASACLARARRSGPCST